MQQEANIKVCAHCGAIWPRSDGYRFTNSERMVYEFIRKHPDCTLERIHSWLYNDRSDGGAAINTISVFINRINKQLIGHQIKANRRGPGATYRLVKDPA